MRSKTSIYVDGQHLIVSDVDLQALTVLEFLIKRGSNQSVQAASQEIAPRLAQLQNFSYIAPDGRDQGVNVAHRYVRQ